LAGWACRGTNSAAEGERGRIHGFRENGTHAHTDNGARADTDNGARADTDNGARADTDNGTHALTDAQRFMIARVAAVASLAVAIVVVVLVIVGGSGTYTLNADFQDAGGLVSGNEVLMGPATVGSVQSITLTANGQARVSMSINSGAPLHEGTVARIYENSLSGIANKYVVLEPGSTQAPEIPSGGTLSEQDTYSFVSLDQVFDALDPLTRAGLRNVIQGEAASIQGKSAQASKTLKYLAPGLASTSNLTAELDRNEPAFDGLLVQGAQAMQALASRSSQLADLITQAGTATGAIARQSQALEQALTLLPATLNRATSTFAGLRTTLDALDPLVAKSKIAARRLVPFTTSLKTFTQAAIPTVTALADLIRNPAGTGDLTTLLNDTPRLARLAGTAFPDLVQSMNASQTQLDTLREYTPDVVAALTNLGQASAYYDANGHYIRVQPTFFAFGTGSQGELTTRPPSERYDGLQTAYARCPGGAVQPSPDGSSPNPVSGCQAGSTPPGP
jgi:phospholipid/cholesterol/gamma-HCH transport system substrate-binding protein